LYIKGHHHITYTENYPTDDPKEQTNESPIELGIIVLTFAEEFVIHVTLLPGTEEVSEYTNTIL